MTFLDANVQVIGMLLDLLQSAFSSASVACTVGLHSAVAEMQAWQGIVHVSL